MSAKEKTYYDHAWQDAPHEGVGRNGAHFVALANERTVFINRLYVNEV